MTRAPSTKVTRAPDAAWRADALNRADAILAAPPARPHIERVSGKGHLVQRFALPLDLCPSSNLTRHGKPWVLGKMKERLSVLMFVQAKGGRRAPLPGRPMVRCVRFSALAPDKYADFGKLPIDVLKKLRYIVDDRQSVCDVNQWWEPGPRGNGMVLVEVWTGAAVAKSDRRTA